MNPTRLLFFFFCLVSLHVIAQQRPIQLHLQKNGYIKKRFELGTTIQVWSKSGQEYTGYISFMMADTIFLNSRDTIAVRDIRKIRISLHNKRRKISWEEIGWVTLGVGISTAGMALSKLETWPVAARNSAVIGYSDYFIQKILGISLKKYSYRIGRKFRLRVWDLN